MGAGLPTTRSLPMRNFCFRAIVLAVGILFLGSLTLKSDPMHAQSRLKETVNGAKDSFAGQHQRQHGQEPLTSQGAWSGTAAAILEDDEKGSSRKTLDESPAPNSTEKTMCEFDMAQLRRWQQRYELGEKLEFAKRHVKFMAQDMPRKSLTDVDQIFMAEQAKRLLYVHKKYEAETCPPPLILPVPKSPDPGKANASDYIFGISTTYARFNDPNTSPIDEWAYWLTDGQGNSNGGKLVLMLLDASDEQLEDAYDRLSEKGIDTDVYESDPALTMAARYLTLVPTMYMNPSREGRKWIVICDDDTFFPSPSTLMERMKQFDHNRQMYIGTFSEDSLNIGRHGAQAFGGAGVFISAPLAKTMTERYLSCKTPQKLDKSDTGWGSQGDVLLRMCISDNTETVLTLFDELWQLDMNNDASGWYESGKMPMSLHHFRSWHTAYPIAYTKISRICGEACFMQRFRFKDDFVLSNGYSVAYYPSGADFDFNQVERTFDFIADERGFNADFKMGPQRHSLIKTGRKMAWELKEVLENEDGSLSQVYVRKQNDERWTKPGGEPMCEYDGIIELVWVMP